MHIKIFAVHSVIEMVQHYEIVDEFLEASKPTTQHEYHANFKSISTSF